MSINEDQPGGPPALGDQLPSSPEVAAPANPFFTAEYYEWNGKPSLQYVIADNIESLITIRDAVNLSLGLPQCQCENCRIERGEMYAPRGSGPHAAHGENMLDCYAEPIKHRSENLWALQYDIVTAPCFPADAQTQELTEDWFTNLNEFV